jgi:hypothetical protein
MSMVAGVERNAVMTILNGSCLCGARCYEIDGDVDGVWVCYCSLCRKISGSNGISILVVPKEKFRWVKGEDHANMYQLRETYSVTRCKTCGTPLPVEADETNIYVTAGTLDVPLSGAVRTHIFCGSRADWDHDHPDVRFFDERSS